MNLTKEHLQAAVNAGLAITDPNQDLLDVYRRHTQGITILTAVLEGINAGQIILSAPQMQPPEGAELPPGAEPPGDFHNPEDLKPGGTDPDD